MVIGSVDSGRRDFPEIICEILSLVLNILILDFLFLSGQGCISKCGSWTRKATLQASASLMPTVADAMVSSKSLKLFSQKESEINL